MSIKREKPSGKAQAKQAPKTPSANEVERTSSNGKIFSRRKYVKAFGTVKEIKIRRAESRIPQLAEEAMKTAYQRALASGSKVLIAEAGELKEISSDGTKRTLKKIAPPVKMQRGMKIKIK